MNDQKINSGLRNTAPLLLPIALAALAGLVVHSAADYGVTARRLPMLTGSIVVILAVLDLVSRLPGSAGRLVRLTLGAGFNERELDFEPHWRTEWKQLAWVPAVVAMIFVVGLWIAIPVFVFFYSWLHGRWPPRFSALAAVSVGVIVFVVFDVALDYELYRGVLFGAEAGL